MKRNPLFWILLAAGLCCCAVSLARRFAAEQTDRQAAYALRYADAQALAAADGTRSTEDWLGLLADAGVGYLIGTDADETESWAAAWDAGMDFARSGDTALPGDAFLLPPVKNGEPLAYGEAMGDPSVPLALVEDLTRTGVVMPPAFSPEHWQGSMVKTLYLYPDYAAGYTGAGIPESGNILFRAISERGVRLAVLTPLRDTEGSIVAEPEVYTAMLTDLTARLAQRGIVAGGEFSCLNAPALSRPLLAGIGLLLAALAVLFVQKAAALLGKRLSPRAEFLLLAAGTVLVSTGAVALTSLTQRALSFGGALLTGCWGVLWLVYQTENAKIRALPPVSRALLSLAGTVLTGLAGGLYVSAVLASRRFMLGFDVFSGVKAAQALPLVLAALALYWALFYRSDRRLRERKLSLLLAAVVLLIAGAALLLRSGDVSITGTVEMQVRDWLERTLYARPRTKEFLLAFPAAMLFALALVRDYPVAALLLGTAGCIGTVSVTNTFCHTFTPLRVSLIRTGLGVAAGAVLGLLALLICAALTVKISAAKKGKKSVDKQRTL